MQVAVDRVTFHARTQTPPHGPPDSLAEAEGAVEGARAVTVKTVVNERSGFPLYSSHVPLLFDTNTYETDVSTQLNSINSFIPSAEIS